MKQYLYRMLAAVIMLLESVGVAFAEDLISHYFVQNDETFDIDGTIASSSPLRFSTIDESTQGEWYVYKLLKNGNFVEITGCRTSGNSLVFDPAEVWWNDSFRIFDSALCRDLFEIQVKFVALDGAEDVKNVRMKLLPSRPQFKSVIFTYAYDWEWDDIYPNGLFTIQAHSDDAELFIFNYTESFLFELDKNIFFQFCQKYECKEDVKIEFDADWGEFITVQAQNSFGIVTSDTLLTTSYITEEDILNRIDELHRRANVDEIASDVDSVSWDGRTLQFIKPMQNVSICGIAGSLVVHHREASELDLSNLPSGIYVVTYEDRNKHNYKKIFKR